VPGDHGVEAPVEGCVRVDRVQPDPMTEAAEALDRRHTGRGVEVVELAASHEEVGRADAELRLELRQLEGRIEGQIDVVPQQEVARLGLSVEGTEAVAAL